MRQSSIRRQFAWLGLGFLVNVGTCLADDSWPQWRGPNRDGFAAPQSLLSSWPDKGPSVAWSYEDAGAGYSSVSVENGKVYTLGKLDGKATAICLDSKTGKKLWQTPFGDGKASYNTGWGDGPRGTPTIDGDFIYCVSDMGTVACLNKSSGDLVWAREFVKEFGGGVPVWGYSESPLIDGDRVVVTPATNHSWSASIRKLARPSGNRNLVTKHNTSRSSKRTLAGFLSISRPPNLAWLEFMRKPERNYSFIRKRAITLPSSPLLSFQETLSITHQATARLHCSGSIRFRGQTLSERTLSQQQRKHGESPRWFRPPRRYHFRFLKIESRLLDGARLEEWRSPMVRKSGQGGFGFHRFCRWAPVLL